MNDLIRQGRAQSLERLREYRHNDPMRRRWREEQAAAAATGPSEEEVYAKAMNDQIRKTVRERKRAVDLRHVRSNG